MEPHQRPLPLQIARAAAVVAACGVVAWFMESYFDPANLILVFMAGVVFVAATSSRVGAWWSIALSISVFDFVFVPPRWGFHPTRPQDYFTLAVMVGVGVLVTELSTRARREASEARWRADRLQALNALSLALAAAHDEQTVHRAAADCVATTLGLPARVVPHEDPEDGTPLAAGEDTFGKLVTGPLPEPAAQAREFIAAVAAQATLACSRLRSDARSSAAAVQAEGERLRSTLLSGLSHDFRTPLTTIVGSATSLIEQEALLEPETKRRLLHHVLREARRLDTMTSTMLDLTRMEEGAIQPRFEWCHADDLVHEVLHSMEPSLRHVQLALSFTDDRPLWCDPDLLERVITNLLDNAARFTPDGGRVELRCGHLEHAWELQVSDTGPGVPEADRLRIFGKFVRLAPGGDGTGLGLALCASIARLHGGTMAVHDDGGAVFTLRLPQPAQPGALEA